MKRVIIEVTTALDWLKSFAIFDNEICYVIREKIYFKTKNIKKKKMASESPS